MSPKRPIATACAAFLLLGLAAAASANTPLPRRQARSVYDVAGVISPQHERQMEALHTELFQKTGVAIIVLSVPELVDETIEELAVRVGQQWGAGRKGEDRGIAIAFSKSDRKIFVATGYGVEGYLPDGRVGDLLDEFAIPHLRRDDFSAGLSQLSAALVSVSAAEYGATISGVPKVRRAPQRRSFGARQIIFGILGILGFLYMLIKHPRLLFLILLTSGRGGRGGGGFGGGGFGGFGGGGFGGGGAGRSF